MKFRKERVVNTAFSQKLLVQTETRLASSAMISEWVHLQAGDMGIMPDGSD